MPGLQNLTAQYPLHCMLQVTEILAYSALEKAQKGIMYPFVLQTLENQVTRMLMIGVSGSASSQPQQGLV